MSKLNYEKYFFFCNLVSQLFDEVDFYTIRLLDSMKLPIFLHNFGSKWPTVQAKVVNSKDVWDFFSHIVQVQPTLINCSEGTSAYINNLHGHALLDIFFCKNATKRENKAYT